MTAPAGPTPVEFHASIRVPDLAAAVRFYTWLLGAAPKDVTARYATFVSATLRTNFVVVVVDDGKDLHHDTLYHLGVGLGARAEVVAAHHQARAAGWTVHKPARTTWRGTPLHELWLKDPGGNLIELYARLTGEELAQMPADQAPTLLVDEPWDEATSSFRGSRRAD
jgi:arsenate reductase